MDEQIRYSEFLYPWIHIAVKLDHICNNLGANLHKLLHNLLHVIALQNNTVNYLESDSMVCLSYCKSNYKHYKNINRNNNNYLEYHFEYHYLDIGKLGTAIS